MYGKRYLFARGGLVSVILLLACVPRIRTVETRDGAFIYGFFDVPEKVGQAHCVGLLQAEDAGGGAAGCMMTSPEGLFFIQNVPPLRYNVHGFYIGNEFHSLGSLAKPFRVAPGSMHYFGTFKYHRVADPGVFAHGKYNLTPVSHPTHAQVLTKILQQKDLDPRWKKRISARLRELGSGE